MIEAPKPHFDVEMLEESRGFCDCCGQESRCVWGFVHDEDCTRAAYYMHWTIGHLSETGANFDLILGPWGGGTSADDRVLVSMVHRQQPDGSPQLMVIDAAERLDRRAELVGNALARSDVIGTPLAQQVFALVDAIYEQDDRFF